MISQTYTLKRYDPAAQEWQVRPRPINEDSLDMIETTKLSHWEIHRSNPRDFYLLHFFERKLMGSGDVGNYGFQDITSS